MTEGQREIDQNFSVLIECLDYFFAYNLSYMLLRTEKGHKRAVHPGKICTSQLDQEMT